MLLGSVNYFIELRSDNNCVLGINMWYSEWSLGEGMGEEVMEGMIGIVLYY